MTRGMLAVAALPFLSLSGPIRADQKLDAPESITLSSGVKVRVLDVRMYPEDELPTLFVDYLTSLPIRDRCALRGEVRQVWRHFKGTAEEHAAKRVFVVPNDAPVGGGLIAFALRRTEPNGWVERGAFSDSGCPKEPSSPKP